MAWRESVFAQRSFPSFDAPLPASLKETCADTDDSPRVEFANGYFLPFNWQAPAEWVQRYGGSVKRWSNPLREWAAASDSRRGGTRADLLDILREGCPERLVEGFSKLMKQPLFIQNMFQALEGDEDLREDPVISFAAEELGYDLEQSQNALIAGNTDVFDNSTFWSALSDYRSIELSSYNVLNNEHVARIVALHLTRHIYAYKGDGLIPQHAADEPPPRTRGWTTPRILLITTTKLHALAWLERCRTIMHQKKASGKRSKKHRIEKKNAAEDAYAELLGEFSDLTESGEVDVASEMGLELLGLDKRKQRKPLDFIDAFRGNNDDNFVYGFSLDVEYGCMVTAAYEQAEVIVASPSVLRQLLSVRNSAASEGSEEGSDSEDELEGVPAPPTAETSCAWLSSIEICVIDRADQLLMSNAENLLTILSELNLPPATKPRGVDISRMRPAYFAETDESKFYRQTVVLTQHRDPLLTSLLQKHDANFRGLVKLRRGHSDRVARQTLSDFAGNLMCVSTGTEGGGPQALAEVFRKHFVELFHNKLFNDQIVLVVPSYLEWLEVQRLLRNGLSTDNFLSLHEQTEENEIAGVRRALQNGQCPILLTTERFLFHRRYRTAGAYHVVYYGAPKYPQIFEEIIADALKAPRHVGMEGGHSTTHLALIYWDPVRDVDALERVVGLRNIYNLIKSTAGSITAVAQMI